MKKILKMIFVILIVAGLSFSIMNFVSSDVNARIRNSDGVTVKAVNDCWTKYHIDCFIVEVGPPKK